MSVLSVVRYHHVALRTWGRWLMRFACAAGLIYGLTLDVLRPWLLLLVVIGMLWFVAHQCTQRVFRSIAGIVFLLTALSWLPVWDLAHLPNESAKPSLDIEAHRGLSELLLSPFLGNKDFGLVLSVAVLALLLLLFRLLDQWNTRRLLPRLEVTDVKDERGRRRPDLESRFSDYLFRSVPHVPPSIPGGSRSYFESFLETPSEKSASWIERLLIYFGRLVAPPSGLRITATLVRREDHEPSCGVTVEVKDIHSDETATLRTFWEDSTQTAIMQAACFVAAYSIRRCPTLPNWEQWQDEDGRALRNYWEGHRAVQRGDPDSAEPHFREAVRLSPSQYLCRFELGLLFESKKSLFEAVALYLELANQHPRLTIARYRLAVALAMLVSEHLPENGEQLAEADINFLSSAEKQRLVRLINTYKISDAHPKRPEPNAEQGYPDRELRDYLLELSSLHLEWLKCHLGWWRLLFWSQRLPAYGRRVWHSHLSNPSRLRARRATISTALCCVRLRQHSDKGHPEAVKHREKLRSTVHGEQGKGWGEAHYNAACFYSLSMTPPEATGEQEPKTGKKRTPSDAEQAVAHLRYAMQDSEGAFSSPTSLQWVLENDPDLNNLRRHPDFQEWRRLILAEQEAPAPYDATQVLRSRYKAQRASHHHRKHAHARGFNA